MRRSLKGEHPPWTVFAPYEAAGRGHGNKRRRRALHERTSKKTDPMDLSGLVLPRGMSVPGRIQRFVKLPSRKVCSPFPGVSTIGKFGSPFRPAEAARWIAAVVRAATQHEPNVGHADDLALGTVLAASSRLEATLHDDCDRSSCIMGLGPGPQWEESADPGNHVRR